MKHIAVLLLFLAPAFATGQTVLYGVDIPEVISDTVSAEEEELRNDTALFIERHRRLQKYEDAIRAVEKERAISQYRHDQFPQYTPELVIEKRRAQAEYERARKGPLQAVQTSIRSIDIDPMSPQLHEVVASVGEPTRLVFFDQTGAPWPVLKTRVGKANRFTATILDEISGQNQIGIELQDNFVVGNVLVNLQDYSVPVVIRIVASEVETTSYANIRIGRSGPNAKLSMTPTAGIQDIGSCQDVFDLLDNTYVKDAQRLFLDGLSGQVWATPKHTYIRSPYRLVFPFGSCQTSDGNGNYAARVDGSDVRTATFINENGGYQTVRILDAQGGVGG